MLMLVADGFLGEDWRDVVDVMAMIGVAATFLALIIAIIQIRRTTKTAEAARNAAISTRTDLAENLRLSDLTSAVRRISEIKHSLKAGQYQVASLRLDDLRELLVQVGASHDPSAGEIFGKALSKVSSLQKALDGRGDDSIEPFDLVKANSWLVEVSDVLIRFATEARMQTGEPNVRA